MKKEFTVLLIIALLFASCKPSQRNNYIELPLTYQKGYGPFLSSMRTLDFREYDVERPWANPISGHTGIPGDWTEVSVSLFQMDMNQFLYQKYRQGDIDEDFYNRQRNSRDWFPDELTLSETPIKCFVGIVRGKTPQGNFLYIVDADNNLDFSDNEPFALTPLPLDVKVRDSLVQHAIPVKYERIYQNKVQTEETLLVMQLVENRSDLVIANLAQYATATFGRHKLGVLSAGFGDMTFQHPSVAVIPPHLPQGESIAPNAWLQKGEYMELDDTLYKILKVDRNRDVLCLQRMAQTRNELESTQTGFKALPIAGREFTSNDSLTLHSFKGRYLYLDFWSVSCGSCIREFSGLRDIYARADRSRFDILGIVGDSDAKSARRIIETHQVTWPQLQSTDDNPVIRTYGISSYPNTFLIDPDGVIIARNLWGEGLRSKLRELGVIE